MKILSLETSTKNFSIALSQDKDIVVSRHFKLTKVLSSCIIPTLKMVLKKAGWTLQDLNGFAIGLGPGSFTSLRVGLSTVKALSFATGKPIVGVCSLDLLAMNAPPTIEIPICVVCDARRNLVYNSFYQKTPGTIKRIGEYSLVGIEEVFSTGLSRLNDYLWPIGLNAGLKQFPTQAGKIRAAVQANRPFPIQTRKPLSKIKTPVYFIGDGVGLYRERLIKEFGRPWKDKTLLNFLAPEKIWYPQAKHLSRVAYDRFLHKSFDPIDTIVPLYLYPEDCQVHK